VTILIAAFHRTAGVLMPVNEPHVGAPLGWLKVCSLSISKTCRYQLTISITIGIANEGKKIEFVAIKMALETNVMRSASASVTVHAHALASARSSMFFLTCLRGVLDQLGLAAVPGNFHCFFRSEAQAGRNS
jgi:C4-type Zn-finger protein